MSGVYIKDMKMPTRCCECRLSTCNSFKERPLCDVLVEYMSYGEWEAKRLDNCPLVSVPPHGRLKDADALMMRISHEAMEAYMDGVCYGVHPNQEYLDLLGEIIDDAPTVIPADQAEESET